MQKHHKTPSKHAETHKKQVRPPPRPAKSGGLTKLGTADTIRAVPVRISHLEMWRGNVDFPDCTLHPRESWSNGCSVRFGLTCRRRGVHKFKMEVFWLRIVSRCCWDVVELRLRFRMRILSAPDSSGRPRSGFQHSESRFHYSEISKIGVSMRDPKFFGGRFPWHLA